MRYVRGNGPLIELKRGEDYQKKLKPGLSSYTDPDETTHPIQDATKGISDLLELAREQVRNWHVPRPPANVYILLNKLKTK